MKLPLLTVIEQKIAVACAGKISIKLLLGRNRRQAKGQAIIRQRLHSSGTAHITIAPDRRGPMCQLIIRIGYCSRIIISNTWQIGKTLRIDGAWEIDKTQVPILKLRLVNQRGIVARPYIHGIRIAIILIGYVKGRSVSTYGSHKSNVASRTKSPDAIGVWKYSYRANARCGTQR